MDNLTATALAARKAGMSYGQYVALNGVRCIAKPIVVDVPTKICPECGKEFARSGRRTNAIYCDSECQRIHNERLNAQRYHKRKKAKEAKGSQGKPNTADNTDVEPGIPPIPIPVPIPNNTCAKKEAGNG